MTQPISLAKQKEFLAKVAILKPKQDAYLAERYKVYLALQNAKKK